MVRLAMSQYSKAIHSHLLWGTKTGLLDITKIKEELVSDEDFSRIYCPSAQTSGGIKAKLTMAKEKRLRKGSSTRERGCTHGSASARINPVDAISGTLLTSIMCSDVALVIMACEVVIMGVNADAAPSKRVAINNRN